MMRFDDLKIVAPASKSYLQRALAIASLARGTSVLTNVSWSNDSRAAAEIVKNFGATLSESHGDLTVQSSGLHLKTDSYTAGEAGLSIRMFSPVLALDNVKVTFTGEGSLLTRPVGIIADALSQLGAKVAANNGLLPLTIQGPLQPGTVHIDGSLSSQILTGLLMALPLLKGDSIILVDNLKSKPYIDMTLSIMHHFGVEVEHEYYRVFRVKGHQQYKAARYNVEGDWSGAAFFLVLGAVKGRVEVMNLNTKSSQADRQIVSALEKAGAEVKRSNNSVVVEKKELNAFEFDATDCPDLFPPLACLASRCKGTSIIKGVSRLTHKESNRAETIKQEFKKMGIDIMLKNDLMLITGSEPIPCIIDSHNDHRIAMAGGIMNLFCASGSIRVKNREAVNKSYPGFFEEVG
ncbi:MAG: 3-phosphoshikimate 1-carboxyvinyltransferase [Bacteroidetes bacterium]|nr:MAG: 3-phosphoshikimate 1-carboxyvinyltransferase [Bacteroidota bacterium]